MAANIFKCIDATVNLRASCRIPHRSSRRSQARTSTCRCCQGDASAAEQALRTAAQRGVDAFVKDGSVVGLGHGTTVIYALEHIASRVANKTLKDISCVSGSSVSAVEAAVHGLPLRDLQDAAVKADVTFLDADEIDCRGDSMAVITGRAYEGASVQQPQLPLLRRLLSRSTDSVALVSGTEKSVRRLGGALPVFIRGEDWETTAEELDDMFLGDAEVWRRPQEGTANPRGGDRPYVSPEGHNILDVRFRKLLAPSKRLAVSSLKLYGELVPYSRLAEEIMSVVGVVTHGLLLNGVTAAVIADGPEAKIVEKGLMLGFKDSQQ